MNDYYDINKREFFIQEVSDGLHDCGFFAVKNSGISKKLIEDSFLVIKHFFSLDMESKMLLDASQRDYHRGYVPFGVEKAQGAHFPDCKEYWHQGGEFTNEELQYYGYQENMYPESTAFKEVLHKFMRELDSHTKILQEVFAEILGVKKDFFWEQTKKGDSLLRAIHYPSIDQDGFYEEGMWAAAHTDINLFTILPKATHDGLEVKMSDGTFKPINVEDDTFIVNAGDFLEIFSNGYFKAGVHRVSGYACDEDRYSIVYFKHLRPDDCLFPLPGAIKKTGGVQKYAIATRLEMLLERYADNRVITSEMLEQLEESIIIERLAQFGRESDGAREYLEELGYRTSAQENQKM